MVRVLSALLVLSSAAGCSQKPNLHEAEGVDATVEKLLGQVDSGLPVYEVEFFPTDPVTPDANSVNLRYDDGGTMMFRGILLNMDAARQLAPRSETMGFLAGNTPRPISQVDFSHVAANVAESSALLPADVDFRSVGSYVIRPNGASQEESWVLHTTPKDGSNTHQVGNIVDVEYTAHRFHRAPDGSLVRGE